MPAAFLFNYSLKFFNKACLSKARVKLAILRHIAILQGLGLRSGRVCLRAKWRVWACPVPQSKATLHNVFL